jgi:osmotically-inducible protein OsmY
MLVRSNLVTTWNAIMGKLLVGTVVALVALTACKQDVAGAEADNTARNERDRDGSTATPLDQGNAEGDLRIVEDIREALVDNDELSVNAHNVKVICVDGLVTLRGPVESTAERTTIESIAKGVSGVTRVDNQLEVDAR